MRSGQEKGPVVAGPEEVTKEETSTAIVADDSDGRKRTADFKARFALAGFAVHETSEGGFLVCRWNLAKHCPDMGALAAFAKLVGVR
ncbi:hypothetical protein JI739_09170 [Ramlibacter sp. AW1]|uniref:Uncharacterized protein n=1 Tax=Ramlibacter aurantiacus TaxID=2801330 RepID=A0A936ZSV3_9BURK|nr:hypothetical protein [Ramlibacter aurantiacus]MBL0420510.1 hypothetical protein [Ramlibacter aurantiacus]